MLITNKVLKELKDGEVTKEEVVNELIANYPVTSIVEDYVTLAMETPIDCNKIVVSREEFEAIVSLLTRSLISSISLSIEGKNFSSSVHPNLLSSSLIAEL